MGTRTYPDKDLIEKALAAVKRQGVNARLERWGPKTTGSRADACIVLRLKAKKVRYTAEVKRGLRPATLGAVIQQLQHLGK